MDIKAGMEPAGLGCSGFMQSRREGESPAIFGGLQRKEREGGSIDPTRPLPKSVVAHLPSFTSFHYLIMHINSHTNSPPPQ
jgi:hypothetical protein